MTSGTMVAVALAIAGLMLGLDAGSNAAPMRAHPTTTPLAGFPNLPPPPHIVGYPPQVYMNMLPPGVVDPRFRSNFGFDGRVHRHDFHRFDRSFQNDSDR